MGDASINTSSNNLTNQHPLGQDGHDQQSHGITESSSTASTISKANEHKDVVSDSNGNVRNMTIKERLRNKLLNTKPPYDK